MRWIQGFRPLERRRDAKRDNHTSDTRRCTAYEMKLSRIRNREYPMLKDCTYLDHSGTTLYAKSLIDRFSQEMRSSLLGNPHSGSPSSRRSTQRIEHARSHVLQYFNADPEHFDVVFVANATAGVKLVMDAFHDHRETTSSSLSGDRDETGGFWYGYHRDCHTSLVGVREYAARGHHCFASDDAVEQWLSPSCGDAVGVHRSGIPGKGVLGLFAYPAQSNLNGRRTPLDWVRRLRQSTLPEHSSVYSLLDIAAIVSTSKFDLSVEEAAPDFTVLSFYKIFGFPDLGAVIVRKQSSGILQKRRYFGGGTVDMVTCLDESWHVSKSRSIHDGLEDGTLPFHNIIALDLAITVHEQLYGVDDEISRHVTHLSKHLYDGMAALRHSNGRKICQIDKNPGSTFGDSKTQGPVVTFNIRDSEGAWVGKSLVEKLASTRNIHLRTGSLCNPGGIASVLDLTVGEMRKNFAEGQRCGDEHDVMDGKPTGVVRVSLGAMSNRQDVDVFIRFLREVFTDFSNLEQLSLNHPCLFDATRPMPKFSVTALQIYPIKSCHGWSIPLTESWKVHDEGLAWDREWCIVHLGTGDALSQKQHPRMALIQPSLDLRKQMLYITIGTAMIGVSLIPVSSTAEAKQTKTCYTTPFATRYADRQIRDFFTTALGVPCTLARFAPIDPSTQRSLRHSKVPLRQHLSQFRPKPTTRPSMRLSNESPILIVSQSSLNQLNHETNLQLHNGQSTSSTIDARVFRANIVITETAPVEEPTTTNKQRSAYLEESWTRVRIGGLSYTTLGPCRRCSMICVDPDTGEKNAEPLARLTRTRRRTSDGRVFFGVHCCAVVSGNGKLGMESELGNIRVGDVVEGFL